MKSAGTFRSSLAAVLIAAATVGMSASTTMAACTSEAQKLLKTLDGGSWRGSGSVQPIGGVKERISCRVSYNAGGARVAQKISCAGTDYKIDATADVRCNGDSVSGTWTERTANNTGQIRGSINGKRMKLDVKGPNFEGRFDVRVANRSRHSLTITQFDPGRGRHVPVAEIALRR